MSPKNDNMLKLLFTACVFYDGTNEVTQILFKFYSKYFLSTKPHHPNISYCIDIFLFFPVYRAFKNNKTKRLITSEAPLYIQLSWALSSMLKNATKISSFFSNRKPRSKLC